MKNIELGKLSIGNIKRKKSKEETEGVEMILFFLRTRKEMGKNGCVRIL